MYLYYQKLPGVTEISLSSDGRTNFLDWRNKLHKKDADFILYALKQIPIQNRIMDEKTYIWSIFGPTGDIILAHFESFIRQGMILKQVTMIEVTDDLQARLSAGRLDRPLCKQGIEEIKFKEEDFFYASPAQESILSTEDLYNQLSHLLDIDASDLKTTSDKDLKKLYRNAALRYHPDRNNGDGAKMSELNMLWGIFNQGVSK